MNYSKYEPFRDSRFGSSRDRLHPDYVDPVCFFGDGAVDPAAVSIVHRAREFWITDPLIASFANEVAARMRDEGMLYEGPMSAKLVDYDFDDKSPSVEVQPTDYGLQAGTCFALDLPDARFAAQGGSLRSYYRAGIKRPTVKNNPLAICLGVCGLLTFNENGRRSCLLVRRSPHLASLGGMVGPSVAGVVDYSVADLTLAGMIERSLGAEINEEIGLHEDEFRIMPLAWALELYRGERPQIFCLIETPLARLEVEQKIAALPERGREFDSYRVVSLDTSPELPACDLGLLNPEAAMNYRLLQTYIRTAV